MFCFIIPTSLRNETQIYQSKIYKQEQQEIEGARNTHTLEP